MEKTTESSKIIIGVVGLGLMGRSIVTALLLSNHEIKAIAPIPEDMISASTGIREQLEHCEKSGLLSKSVNFYLAQLQISEDYTQLNRCGLVIECVIENIEIKSSVYERIAAAVTKETIIASNTSAIPITVLQKSISYPERFLGIHWAEPAYMTPFLEITCGDLTFATNADWIYEIAHGWGKEPTLLRKDIRGFVTNRLMYAVYRELFNLVENKKASIEDADKVFKYDVGSWITMMGIFQRMDFEGLEDYPEIFRNLFPELSNADEVPEMMQEMIRKEARGIHNGIGLYDYTEEEARKWEEAFALFNKDIYKLATSFPSEQRKEKKAKLKINYT